MQSALNNALPQNYPRRVREKLLIFLEVNFAFMNVLLYNPFTQLQNNEQAISLIDQMLSLSPERRPTAEEALDHNFFWEAPLSAENIKGLVDKLKGVWSLIFFSFCSCKFFRQICLNTPLDVVHTQTEKDPLLLLHLAIAAEAAKAPNQCISNHENR